MANIHEFLEKLKSCPDDFEYRDYELGGKTGYLVTNRTFDTRTHFTHDAIERNDVSSLLNQTYQGRLLEHMTRVTGFFSKTESWNKGKLGELKERRRELDFHS
ncbi:MAG: hypothetical protein CVT48_00235 [Thermoplasmata archaeon HGW-Thermoplasmata-1]|nr:MAG: hypothetical protein CVT48_00235 [Thermoplasmata archaeon HGW-Thermoplasmata-1]